MLRLLFAVGVMAIAFGIWMFFKTDHARQPTRSDSGMGANIRLMATATTSSIVGPGQELSRRKTLFPTFQKHPFAATHEADGFSWTSEDGKNPDVIKQLAHNELEFERMAAESDHIYRRQLVYHQTTTDALIENSRLSGEPVRQLTLPGLDGQEIQFDITKTDLNPSGQQGTFAGHVAGHLDSTVTLAFKGKREAFTILSSSEGIYLVGEPREPGELIVKSINPQTYIVGDCGTP